MEHLEFSECINKLKEAFNTTSFFTEPRLRILFDKLKRYKHGTFYKAVEAIIENETRLSGLAQIFKYFANAEVDYTEYKGGCRFCSGSGVAIVGIPVFEQNGGFTRYTNQNATNCDQCEAGAKMQALYPKKWKFSDFIKYNTKYTLVPLSER
jgi:hypothetical protein